MLSVTQNRIGYAIGVAMLLVIFAYFTHHPLPGAAVGAFCMIIAGWIIARGPVKEIFGKPGDPKLFAATIMAMALLAISGAAYLRFSDGLTPFPHNLRPFAIMAMLIGSMEELVFRGWMASSLKNRNAAVIIPALAHAAYKSTLFLSPMVLYDLDVAGLFQNTLLLGILLGLTRQITGSVWPAVVAHALFDLVVYGDAAMPWWVM